MLKKILTTKLFRSKLTGTHQATDGSFVDLLFDLLNFVTNEVMFVYTHIVRTYM